MKPSKQSAPTAATFTGKAVYMRKEPCGFLACSYELEIVDGVVVSEIALNSADLPASAAGAGSRSLWSMFQGNNK